MIDFLPPVLMGEARQQQQVVLCWDTRTTQPCTPLVTGVGGGGGMKGVFYIQINHHFINLFKTIHCGGAYLVMHQVLTDLHSAHKSSSAVQHFKHKQWNNVRLSDCHSCCYYWEGGQ